MSPPDSFLVGSMLKETEMPNEAKRRCRHCGGTLWKDGDVVKCFMCSRPAAGESASDRALADLTDSKLPVNRSKYAFARIK